MPRLITKDEAIAWIRAYSGDPPCLMCAVRDGRVGTTHVVVEDDALLVILPRYVTRWGHVMVLPRQHVTSFRDAPPELWAHVNATAHRAARVAERVMGALRCHVASTGSPRGEHPNTSEHLHVHVLPVTDPADRPRRVFSWDDGVWIAEPEEWAELLARYRTAWADDA